MGKITLNMPESFRELKRKYPKVNWNAVIKRGVLKRLEELQKFQKLKAKGVL
jgi:hypothetical protein